MRKSRRNNRKAGIVYELQIIKELKELGYDDCVSSRSESKNLDNKGVDIVSQKLPYYIQIKNSCKTIDYNKLIKNKKLNKPLVVIHKKTSKSKVNFVTEGEYVIMTKDLFYEFIRKTNSNSEEVLSKV